MATHHLDEIPTSATHAALLRGGALLAAGPLEDVLAPERLERASACGCAWSGPRAAGSARRA